MRIAVAGAGVASAIPEGIELLDIADGRAGLLGDEGAQPDLEGAVAQGIEFAGGQGGGRVGARTQRKDQRLVLARRDDRGGEADRQRQSLLRRRMLLGKGHGASAPQTFIRAPRRLQTQNWGD